MGPFSRSRGGPGLLSPSGVEKWHPSLGRGGTLKRSLLLCLLAEVGLELDPRDAGNLDE